MEQKFKVNQVLKNRTTGNIEKIYAVTKEGQPFDLLDISLLVHYGAVTVDGLKDLLSEHSVGHTLEQTGNTFSFSLDTKESADAYVEHIAPLFNQILQ